MLKSKILKVAKLQKPSVLQLVLTGEGCKISKNRLKHKHGFSEFEQKLATTKLAIDLSSWKNSDAVLVVKSMRDALLDCHGSLAAMRVYANDF